MHRKMGTKMLLHCYYDVVRKSLMVERKIVADGKYINKNERGDMNIIKAAADFFLSEWLWSITWGLYHVPINIFVMLFIFKRYTKANVVRAMVAAFCANIFSLSVFTAFVVGVLVKFVGIEYVVEPKGQH